MPYNEIAGGKILNTIAPNSYTNIGLALIALRSWINNNALQYNHQNLMIMMGDVPFYNCNSYYQYISYTTNDNRDSHFASIAMGAAVDKVYITQKVPFNSSTSTWINGSTYAQTSKIELWLL